MIFIIMSMYPLAADMSKHRSRYDTEKCLGILENGFIPYGIHLEWTFFGK